MLCDCNNCSPCLLLLLPLPCLQLENNLFFCGLWEKLWGMDWLVTPRTLTRNNYKIIIALNIHQVSENLQL